MSWDISVFGAEFLANVLSDKIKIKFTESTDEGYVEISSRPNFEVLGDEFVFMPACCYDGNRFEVLKKDYPPRFTPEEAKLDMPIIITDVPRIEKDGSGIIEVTTGDLSVPLIAVYSKRENKAIFIFTIQEIDGKNLGISYEKGKIGITYPHMRKNMMYIWPHMVPSRDKGIKFEKGQEIEIPFKIVESPCKSIEEFYEIFFKNRKCMGLDDSLPVPKPIDYQFEIHKEKLNKYNWQEKGQFYGTAMKDQNVCWQAGWVGGAMYTYPLMKLGGELEWERSIKTLEHLFRTQGKSGFYCDQATADGDSILEAFNMEYSKKWHLLRRSGDILYFLFKHFYLIKERGKKVPQAFEEGARKNADGFVKMWKKYGQLGQFVNLDTGDIIIGGGDGAAIAAAGLAEAARYFNEPNYIDIAKEIGEYFYQRLSKNGCTVGGPGDILQGPDSESAGGLLESMVVLYEYTKDEKWLKYAKTAAEYLSSWVVAYNYKFPTFSEFYKKDKKTTGCVFANVQNKHAAPGLCTLSGDSIYRLYQWTKDEMYKELFMDITKSVSQYLSAEDEPIYSWDVPLDAVRLYDLDNIPTVESQRTPSGFMCERVNMSDWESERCIGGIFPISCIWCETANLLILADCGELIYQDSCIC